MKVVINRCYGGFSISDSAVKWIRKNAPCEHQETLVGEYYSDNSGPKASFHLDSNYGHGDARDCPSLIQAVEALGKNANGSLADLGVVEIPDGIAWGIGEYDGVEHIYEQHRTWY